jgi:hypothetical protein
MHKNKGAMAVCSRRIEWGLGFDRSTMLVTVAPFAVTRASGLVLRVRISSMTTQNPDVEAAWGAVGGNISGDVAWRSQGGNASIAAAQHG